MLTRRFLLIEHVEPLENSLHFLGGLSAGVNEFNFLSDRFGDCLTQNRIMCTAKNQRVNFLVFEFSQILFGNQLCDLIVRPSVFSKLYKEAAGFGVHINVSVILMDLRLIRKALHCSHCANHTDLVIICTGYGRLASRLDNSEHRNLCYLPQPVQSH